MSNTAPVVNEFSADAQQGDERGDLLDLDEARARDFRQHVVDVLLRHLVEDRGLRRRRRDAVHRDVVAASSLPSDLVSAITPAFDAE